MMRFIRASGFTATALLTIGFAVSGCDGTSSSGDVLETGTGDDIVVSDKESGDSTHGSCDGTDCESFWDFDELSCRGVHVCKLCCQAGPCFRACEDAGSPGTTQTLQEMYDCTGSTCKNDCGAFGTQEQCTECHEAECGDKIAACTWNPVGSLSCKGLSDCLKGCDTLTKNGTAKTCLESRGLWCFNNCFGNADLDALSKFEAYDKCAWTSCFNACRDSSNSEEAAAKCNACINEKCLEELTSCTQD